MKIHKIIAGAMAAMLAVSISAMERMRGDFTNPPKELDTSSKDLYEKLYQNQAYMLFYANWAFHGWNPLELDSDIGHEEIKKLREELVAFSKERPVLSLFFNKEELCNFIGKLVASQEDAYFSYELLKKPFRMETPDSDVASYYGSNPDRLSLEAYLKRAEVSDLIGNFKTAYLNPGMLDYYTKIGFDVRCLIDEVRKMFRVMFQKAKNRVEAIRSSILKTKITQLPQEKLADLSVAVESWGGYEEHDDPRQNWRKAIEKLFLPLYDELYYRQKLARVWLREREEKHQTEIMEPELAKLIAEMAGQDAGTREQRKKLKLSEKNSN